MCLARGVGAGDGRGGVGVEVLGDDEGSDLTLVEVVGAGGGAELAVCERVTGGDECGICSEAGNAVGGSAEDVVESDRLVG